jgi:hypothetical protein
MTHPGEPLHPDPDDDLGPAPDARCEARIGRHCRPDMWRLARRAGAACAAFAAVVAALSFAVPAAFAGPGATLVLVARTSARAWRR